MISKFHYFTSMSDGTTLTPSMPMFRSHRFMDAPVTRLYIVRDEWKEVKACIIVYTSNLVVPNVSLTGSMFRLGFPDTLPVVRDLRTPVRLCRHSFAFPTYMGGHTSSALFVTSSLVL
jgi:hypothetical protein